MTTIWLGVTRYGPLAPDACQFGKYDAFTSTGFPTSDTSNEMPLSLVWMFETVGGLSIAVWGGVATAPSTPVHDDGPLTANGTFHRLGSWYQLTATSSHCLPPLATSFM